MPAKRSTAARPAAERSLTPELARDALASIPPDVDRDTWARVGMALKASSLPEHVAFELWDAWSARGESYNANDARATWRSIKAGGGTTVATLFGVAGDHGWKFPEAGRAAQAPDPAEADRIAAARRARHEAEAARYRERADQAARDARELWDSASEDGESGYLKRKGVKAHGLRFLADGTVLVPMIDADGSMMNLQRIAPNGPDAGGAEKRFMPGSRKTGLRHQLGDLVVGEPVLVAEGYATAATLHEATGRPVAVAFDAGNLVHVARVLRERDPAALILVCGDDDRETEARTGRNSGRLAAAKAARAVATDAAAAGATFPDGLPPGATDWNDLAAHAGLDEVRKQIERALASPEVPAPLRPQRGAASACAPGVDATDSPGEAARPDRWGFSIDDRGVWHSKRDGDGWGKRVWLCAPLSVSARTRTDDANGWGYLLEFKDFDGNPKTWAMPSALLSGDGAEWAARLRDMGLAMAVGPGIRNLVASFINTRQPEERVTCTDRVGWHGNVYVLPSGSIGPANGRRYVFQSDGSVEDAFRRRGELADWREGVAGLCAGNSRLVFAVSCAFAGPLLPMSGLEGGGFHLRGDSRGGKTTALRAAASVFGGEKFVQQWRTTANALESGAVQHNHALLVLDELGQLDPREAGDTAYLLANGMDKNRATRGLLVRKRRHWLLLFLSSGEVGMADLMADAGKRVRAGQEVRMVDVPLDAGHGMGGIEQLHEFESPAELAEALKDRARRHYGTAGRAWLEWCAERFASLQTTVRDDMERQRAAFVPEHASGQVRTVGSRFALVAAAGELATAAGVTGWQAGEAARAARTCFEAWLAARGHLDNSEQITMFRQVRSFIEKNGEALFTWTHRALDSRRPNTPLRCGFKRLVDEHGTPVKSDASTEFLERRTSGDWQGAHTSFVEYMVLPGQFRQEICKGLGDPNAVAKVLRDRGHLRHDSDRMTSKQRLPGMGLTQVYLIKPSLFADEL